jgi:hypothetical protein
MTFIDCGVAGNGPNGTLVTATESTTEGFDASSVQETIRNYIQA